MKPIELIYSNFLQNKKQLAVLIDPDKNDEKTLISIIRKIHANEADFILTGGSFISNSIQPLIKDIKKHSDKPVILFPGSLLQLSDQADAIFLLSLISGRNPEFLIGNHVVAAPFLKKSGMDVIPVGYMIIDKKQNTSVSYISNTTPIPEHKTDIIVATAIAGEFLGNKLIYLEGGSGVNEPISPKVVETVKENISVPLIVGGGIKNAEQAEQLYNAGADILVIGNAVEENKYLIGEVASVIKSL